MVLPITSAGGVLSLLDEQDATLKYYSLQQLSQMVDHFWAEVADSVDKIEILFEDEKFPHRDLAAFVAAKVYYHLGEYEDAVSFALGAGKYFDIESAAGNEFVETLLGKCIDKYINVKQSQFEDTTVQVDSRLENVAERMLNRCIAAGELKQAIGIALESHRLDIVESAIAKSKGDEMLKYTLEVSMTLVQNLGFRNQVLETLVKLFLQSKQPDYIAVSQALVWLNDSLKMAGILSKLISGSESDLLTAYQIAFDTYESATQEFLQKLMRSISGNQDDSAMETDGQPASVTSKLRAILAGDYTIKLHLEFLYRNNKADMLILKNTKNALESRSSMYHSAVTFAHAFMTAGTTSDQFLRENMDWLSRASNWSKFSATAQLGVIHKGNVDNSMNLLKPYLPQDGVSSSAYTEGGSLFALGLIHANHGASILDFIVKELKASNNEVVQHGAALGLGAAGMATDDETLFEALKAVLYGDNAVAGEAAGLAMGLVMLGSGNSKALDEMIQYAHETQHEKIIRGLAVGIALIMYAREEKADAVIEQLTIDKDPILRYGGVFTVSLAYAGTANNKAIRRLLHIAVSDASDDVRRAAVMGLGYVLLRTPKQVPRIVQLLSESYNPHVRYGSAMALGLSCAGTGMQEALELLEPLTKDSVDYVRQGAFMAAAMILIQHNEQSNPKVGHYRKLYNQVITEKHMEALARFGAVLGQGIIDAGGRNVTLSMLASNGNVHMESVVGMTLFLQHWYWYPLTHFLCLSFSPTEFIGLNKDLNMPKFEFVSNAKPSLFAYPPPTKAPTTEKVEKVATAVLSTTAKAKARAKKAEKEKGEAMDTDEAMKSPEPEETKAEPMAIEETPKKKEEPASETLQNLARVVPNQLKYVAFPAQSRYVPIRKGPIVGGITMMADTRPTEKVELVEFSTPTVASSDGKDEKEPNPPEPFEFADD